MSTNDVLARVAAVNPVREAALSMPAPGSAARVREDAGSWAEPRPHRTRLRRGLLIGSTILEFGVAALLLVLFVPHGGHHAAGRTAGTPTGHPDVRPMAPNLSLPLLQSGALHGNRVRLGELRGRWVVLTFGASWCAPCRGAQLRAVRTLAREVGPNVVTIVVATLDRASKARIALGARDSAYVLAFDRKGKNLKRLGFAAIPSTALVSPTGRLELTIAGPGLAPVRRALRRSRPAPTGSGQTTTTTG